MSLLHLEHGQKTFGMKTLFKDIELVIGDDERIGLIGINGTGKSTLLKILAAQESLDGGTIQMSKKTRIEYLSQTPTFYDDFTVFEQVFKGTSPLLHLIEQYELTIEALHHSPDDSQLQAKLNKLNDQMTASDAWEVESQVKMILTKLSITDFDAKIKTLSGGQKKRVALASALIAPCDLLILDEPTNHMDHETIDWLEGYLLNRKGALLMVTHDRYFLDRVANKIIELSHGELYSYTGNYSLFVEKKAERMALSSSAESKRQNLYRQELAWMQKGAKARTTKQKARIQRFDTLSSQNFKIDEGTLDIQVGHSRLGRKIMTLEDVSKHFPGKPLINHFSYTMLADDRIGIIGLNGVGKTTLLNLLTGKLQPDSGTIDYGTTLNVSYFSQESETLDETKRAIDYIKETAEFIQTVDGYNITAAQMMDRFLFEGEIQWSYISKLSGGEKRRLYLLKMLMTAPNVLILDEPTNDLDVDTLKVLENYIDEFKGVVITVSHDRFFLDRICNKIFAFDGKGGIIQHTGNYTDYADYKKDYLDVLASTEAVEAKKYADSQNNMTSSNTSSSSTTSGKPVNAPKLKMSFKEQKAYESLPGEIEALELTLGTIEKDLVKFASDFVKLQELSNKKEAVEEQLLELMENYETLCTLAEAIEASKK